MRRARLIHRRSWGAFRRGCYGLMRRMISLPPRARHCRGDGATIALRKIRAAADKRENARPRHAYRCGGVAGLPAGAADRVAVIRVATDDVYCGNVASWSVIVLGFAAPPPSWFRAGRWRGDREGLLRLRRGLPGRHTRLGIRPGRWRGLLRCRARCRCRRGDCRRRWFGRGRW